MPSKMSRNLVPVFRRSRSPRQVLGDDVFEQRCLAAAGHAEHDALHGAHLVRPKPRLSVDVVAEDHRILLPGLFDQLAVARRAHDQRRVHFAVFTPGAASGVEVHRGAGDGNGTQDVHRNFGGLQVGEVIDLGQHQPIHGAECAQADDGGEGWGF